ncbi:MAG: NADH-quinone oxidoreductase subunit NuoG [Gammaproteobacteria bacterium]|nr:NADH-quinone oxidoreductase subunit NuoG [Gammaproteobacteria bacterium]
MVTIEINGIELQVAKGSTVIQAADDAGITIPRFCYHKNLSIAANCRMCLVEVEKVPKALPACATQVTEGMKVKTRSSAALQAQRSVMEFLLINHPLDCPICDQGGECDLQEMAIGFGGSDSDYHEKKRVVRDRSIGPLIATEMTRCIHCTRCVRFGQEVAGEMEMGAPGRGEHMRIGTFLEQGIESELSGNMIDLCPVGALTSKPFRFSARSWEMQKHATVSPHDGVGSNLEVHTVQNQVKRVIARENPEINESWISDRDRFSYEGADASKRLAEPMVRTGDGWRTAPWDEALRIAVDGLKNVISQQGAEQLGALAAPTVTVEEGYLLQSLIRGLGSNNLDHRLRQGDFPVAMLTQSENLFGELEQADAVLLVGSDLRRQQPLLNHRLRRAALAGARVMSLDSVAYDANYDLAEEIVAAPNEVPMMLAGILKAGLHDSTPAGVEQWRDCLSAIQPSAEQQAVAATLAGAERPLVIIGDNASTSPHYGLLRSYSRALAEVTEGGFAVLTPGGNSTGLALAGLLPDMAPGGVALAESGLNAREMLADPRRAYLLLDTEPQLDCWDSGAAGEAMSRADFVVALTPYSSEPLMAVADVLLPIAPFTETPGTFVNLAGLWQTFPAVVTPFAEARPAWKVLRVLGNLFGLDGFDYNTAQDVLAALQSKGAMVARPQSTGDLPPLPVSESGLTRIGELSAYSSDCLVRRAEPLQQRRDSARAEARINSTLAAELAVTAGQSVQVGQGDHRATLSLVVDDAVADGCVVVPAAHPATASLGPAVGSITLASQA